MLATTQAPTSGTDGLPMIRSSGESAKRS